MTIRRILTTITILAAVALSGCVAGMTGSTLEAEPVAGSYETMPPDDAKIATAVAVQAATPPIEQYQMVRFGPAAMGTSRPELGAEKFEFTGARLYACQACVGNQLGLSMGEVEMTDPLGRRATVLYRAEYMKQDGQITLRRLEMQPRYTVRPRVDVTVVRASDLPTGKVETFTDLLAFLAEKGIAPADLARMGEAEYAIFAVGRDWAGPESKLTIAISASKTGSLGHTKGEVYKLLDGMWPVAVAFGTFDPSSTRDELYAKVTYRKEGGFTATTKVGVYQLAGK